MKFAALFSAGAILLSAGAGPAPLQAKTLEELTKEADSEWMIGKWASEDGSAQISYTWRLDKHAVAFTFKMGDRESEGMIIRKPGTEDEVVYGSVDNKGGVSTGRWIEHNGHPTLIMKAVQADGTERKFATEHVKTDADTMTVNLMGVGDDGKPDDSRLHEVIFKRQK
ncbi:MAG: hypothetical protein EOP86_12210 [Verrucomicrobiaceae bacterium]|nr:MAG: hypothetical protein EOP86_12210 [Verrucomicrobiaceae bacterium]